jgi:HemK-related putative methylase
LKILNDEERLAQERASLKVISENAKDDHSFSFNGLNMHIYKEVFSPHYFNGWSIFTPKLRELVKSGEDFLEVGVGSGITSALLAKDGVNVTAVDINSFAVENAKLNFEKNNLPYDDIFLSDVYDGFCSHKKFNAIFWNAPWMETIESERANGFLELGLFDNGFKNIERFIEEAKYYLKPHGRLYIGHADFGDYIRLEKLLKKHGFEYEIVVSKPSVEILDVEFFMYEAKLIEKPNKIFIANPFTGDSYETLAEKRNSYAKIAKKYNLELLEQFVGIEEKREFEEALYEPKMIVHKDINLIDKAQVMLVDLHRPSAGATFEMSYAKLKREILIIGFGCQDEKCKRHPWYGYYCDEIVDTIDEALEIAKRYCDI